MSKSLTLLLQGLGEIHGSEKNTPLKTGFATSLSRDDEMLHNPDVPDMKGEHEASEYMPESAEIKDEYYLDMGADLQTGPRNGQYALNVKQPYVHERNHRKAFTMEGAIDPNLIRSKIDPDSAHPSLSSQSLFSYVPTNFEPTTQVSLIKQSRESEYNYRNRFKPSQQQAQTTPTS